MSVRNIVLSTLLACVLLVLGVYCLAPMPRMQDLDPKSLPWHVSEEAGKRQVLGVSLGHSRLSDLEALYGPVDGLALFSQGGEHRLEAYYEKFEHVGFKAKLIATFDLPQETLQALFERVRDVKGSPSGALRADLNQAQKQDFNRAPIMGLTYIPAFAKLEPELLRSRFGEPERVETLQEGIEQWHYPHKGVTVLWNRDGKEIFEYRSAE